MQNCGSVVSACIYVSRTLLKHCASSESRKEKRQSFTVYRDGCANRKNADPLRTPSPQTPVMFFDKEIKRRDAYLPISLSSWDFAVSLGFSISRDSARTDGNWKSRESSAARAQPAKVCKYAVTSRPSRVHFDRRSRDLPLVKPRINIL